MEEVSLTEGIITKERLDELVPLLEDHLQRLYVRLKEAYETALVIMEDLPPDSAIAQAMGVHREETVRGYRRQLRNAIAELAGLPRTPLLFMQKASRQGFLTQIQIPLSQFINTVGSTGLSYLLQEIGLDPSSDQIALPELQVTLQSYIDQAYQYLSDSQLDVQTLNYYVDPDIIDLSDMSIREGVPMEDLLLEAYAEELSELVGVPSQNILRTMQQLNDTQRTEINRNLLHLFHQQRPSSLPEAAMPDVDQPLLGVRHILITNMSPPDIAILTDNVRDLGEQDFWNSLVAAINQPEKGPMKYRAPLYHRRSGSGQGRWRFYWFYFREEHGIVVIGRSQKERVHQEAIARFFRQRRVIQHRDESVSVIRARVEAQEGYVIQLNDIIEWAQGYDLTEQDLEERKVILGSWLQLLRSQQRGARLPTLSGVIEIRGRASWFELRREERPEENRAWIVDEWLPLAVAFFAFVILVLSLILIVKQSRINPEDRRKDFSLDYALLLQIEIAGLIANLPPTIRMNDLLVGNIEFAAWTRYRLHETYLQRSLHMMPEGHEVESVLEHIISRIHE